MARKKAPFLVIPIELPIMLDIPRAAALICATPWAIRRQIYSGRIGYNRVGSRILIPRFELEKFAETGLRREKAA